MFPEQRTFVTSKEKEMVKERKRERRTVRKTYNNDVGNTA